MTSKSLAVTHSTILLNRSAGRSIDWRLERAHIYSTTAATTATTAKAVGRLVEIITSASALIHLSDLGINDANSFAYCALQKSSPKPR